MALGPARSTIGNPSALPIVQQDAWKYGASAQLATWQAATTFQVSKTPELPQSLARRQVTLQTPAASGCRCHTQWTADAIGVTVSRDKPFNEPFNRNPDGFRIIEMRANGIVLPYRDELRIRLAVRQVIGRHPPESRGCVVRFPVDDDVEKQDVAVIAELGSSALQTSTV